jgi:hypothetical protein
MICQKMLFSENKTPTRATRRKTTSSVEVFCCVCQELDPAACEELTFSKRTSCAECVMKHPDKVKTLALLSLQKEKAFAKGKSSGKISMSEFFKNKLDWLHGGRCSLLMHGEDVWIIVFVLPVLENRASMDSELHATRCKENKVFVVLYQAPKNDYVGKIAMDRTQHEVYKSHEWDIANVNNKTYLQPGPGFSFVNSIVGCDRCSDGSDQFNAHSSHTVDEERSSAEYVEKMVFDSYKAILDKSHSDVMISTKDWLGCGTSFMCKKRSKPLATTQFVAPLEDDFKEDDESDPMADPTDDDEAEMDMDEGDEDDGDEPGGGFIAPDEEIVDPNDEPGDVADAQNPAPNSPEQSISSTANDPAGLVEEDEEEEDEEEEGSEEDE